MSNYILAERMIVESLSLSPKGLLQLSEDTGLRLQVLKAITAQLIEKGHIQIDENQLYKVIPQKVPNLSNSPKEMIRRELGDFFDNFTRFFMQKNQLQGSFKLNKVYLDEIDMVALKRHLSNIELLIQNSQKTNFKNNHLTKNKKVIFWGLSNYGELVEEGLK